MPAAKHASTSTNQELQTKVSSLLQCPICLDQLKKPKSLPCNHNFCSKCLENLKNQKSCPVCRGKNKIKSAVKPPKELIELLKVVKKDMGSEKVAELVEKFEKKMRPEKEPSKEREEIKKNKLLQKSRPKPSSVVSSQPKLKQVIDEMCDESSSKPKASKPKSTKPKPKIVINSSIKRKNTNKNGQPKKLDKKDEKLYKEELTPESSDDTNGSSSDETSEDEGTTRDISSSDDSSSDDSSSSDDDSDSSNDSSTLASSSSDSSDSSSSDSDTSSSDDDDSSSSTDSSDAEDDVPSFKIGKKVAVFPGEESYRKNHADGVVKFKIPSMTGCVGEIYGIALTNSSSRGLGIKMTKKQLKDLNDKQLKWFEKNKGEHLWVEGYMLCESKLVSDI